LGGSSIRLLLDTHIWLWSLLAPERLTHRVLDALQQLGNECWLSPVSVWELLVLVEKKRLFLHTDVEKWIVEAMVRSPMQEAPLTYDVALETRRIRLPHADPADRFIAATARVFELVLVTADTRLLGVDGLATLANR
jgi:PIN domain nuclease of toxin-antitoxin system